MGAGSRSMLLAGVALAMPACHQAQQPQDQNIVVGNGVDINADIETLPPDESSATPSNQLANGDDNPDVNASVNNSD